MGALGLKTAAIAIAGSLLVWGGGVAMAQEDWQLGHGAFLSAADVTAHNRMPLDIHDVSIVLDGEAPDWSRALEHFAFGGNFPNHSLALFADDYNGRFASHLPAASAHFGSVDFQSDVLLAALIGTGDYRHAEPAERKALIEAGLEAVALNWARYELGESRRKANATEPNWSIENGSPKNWNEIFAFWYGPDGLYSVHAALDQREGGAAINEALYQTLADGQAILVENRWTEEHAAGVEAELDRAAVLLLADALAQLAAADDAGRPEARGRAAGYWLAAAEALGDDKAAADTVTTALEPEADPLAIAAALEIVRPAAVD